MDMSPEDTLAVLGLDDHVVHGHELSAQDLDLLGYPCVPPTPWDTPPTLVRGVTAHACQPLAHLVHTAASVPPTSVKITTTSTPASVRLCMLIFMVPPSIVLGTSKAPTPPHPLLFREGRGEGLE